ncbi:MAG: YbgC/FadM family acyl-CoA thioesterase [Chloroflexota bacterium]|nr:YbgC/FadM family acyl-CoA thioesterase [Chloroflexota bacterium]MDQ5865195.1 YbgC/FadM family acyl-CoA thioesterase [Chloroflexota bacterium]
MPDTAPAPDDSRPVVKHTFRVRYIETDAMGIVHHSSYLAWMEMGRTEFMRHFGFTYRQLELTGVLLPVLEVKVRYHTPAYYDDELVISTWVEELSRVRLLLAYRIDRPEDGKILTEGTSLHTFMGKDGRPIRITRYPGAWERLQSMVPHLEK